MDGQLAAFMLVGIAVGAKFLGSMVARRRGLRAEERWENFTNQFRIMIVSVCMALAAGIFYGFLAVVGLKYLALNLFAANISEEQSLLFIGAPVAVVVFMLLWPKTLKLVA